MMMHQTFNRRHSPNRRKTRVEAVLHIDGQSLRVVILDVSFDGMRLSVPENIAPGTAATVEVHDARIPAIIHWSRTRFAGLHLLKRFDSATLTKLETAHDDLAEYR